MRARHESPAQDSYVDMTPLSQEDIMRFDHKWIKDAIELHRKTITHSKTPNQWGPVLDDMYNLEDFERALSSEIIRQAEMTDQQSAREQHTVFLGWPDDEAVTDAPNDDLVLREEANYQGNAGDNSIASDSPIFQNSEQGQNQGAGNEVLDVIENVHAVSGSAQYPKENRPEILTANTPNSESRKGTSSGNSVSGSETTLSSPTAVPSGNLRSGRIPEFHPPQAESLWGPGPMKFDLPTLETARSHHTIAKPLNFFQMNNLTKLEGAKKPLIPPNRFTRLSPLTAVINGDEIVLGDTYEREVANLLQAAYKFRSFSLAEAFSVFDFGQNITSVHNLPDKLHNTLTGLDESGIVYYQGDLVEIQPMLFDYR